MTQFNDRVTIYQYMDATVNRGSNSELEGKSRERNLFLAEASDLVNESANSTRKDILSMNELNVCQNISQFPEDFTTLYARCVFVCLKT